MTDNEDARRRLQASVERLPPLLAEGIAAFLDEPSDIWALWQMCDAIELAVRLLTILRFAEGQEKFGGEIARMGDKLKRPTFATWMEAAERLTAIAVHAPLFEKLPATVSTLVPMARGGPTRQRNEHNSLLLLRNHLAHTPNPALAGAAELREHWAKPFADMVDTLTWLEDVTLFGTDANGAPWKVGRGEHVGPLDTPASEGGALEPDTLYAARGGRVLALWPFSFYGPTDSDEEASRTRTWHLYFGMDAGRPRYSALWGKGALQRHGPANAADAFARLFAIHLPDQLAHEALMARLRRVASESVPRIEEVMQLREWITKRPKAIMVHGAPGIGKSVFMATLACELKDESAEGESVLPFSFTGDDERFERQQFIEQLAAQITPLIGGKVPTRVTVDDIARGLEGADESSTSIIILLDGLDELLRRDPSFVDEVVKPLLKPTVTWVFFGRREPLTAESFSLADHELELPELTVGQVNAMILLHDTGIRARLREQRGGYHIAEAFVRRVHDKAKGNPLYVSQVIKEIVAGRLDLEGPLPEDLRAFHQELANRMGVGVTGMLRHPALALLIVGREPMTIEQIRAMLMRDLRTATPEDVYEAMHSLGSLVRDEDGPTGTEFRLIHERARADLAASHEIVRIVHEMRVRLAEAIKLDDESPLAGYLRRQGYQHLIELEAWQDLPRLFEGEAQIRLLVTAWDGRTEPIIEACRRSFEAAGEEQAEVRSALTRALFDAMFVQQPSGGAPLIDGQALHATLAYRNDRLFYENLLGHAMEERLDGASVETLDLAKNLANILRRNNDLPNANAIIDACLTGYAALDSLPLEVHARKRSSLFYERAYVAFMDRGYDRAIDAMAESINEAERADAIHLAETGTPGNRRGSAQVSRCIWFRFRALRSLTLPRQSGERGDPRLLFGCTPDPKAFAEAMQEWIVELERSAISFAHWGAEGDEDAARWWSFNIHEHRLEAYYLAGDAVNARRVLDERLEDNDWFTKQERGSQREVMRARVLLLEGDPEAALKHLKIFSESQRWHRGEERLREVFDRGRALEMLGRKGEAQRVWTEGLEDNGQGDGHWLAPIHIAIERSEGAL